MVEIGGVELLSKTPINKGLFIVKLKLYTQLYKQSNSVKNIYTEWFYEELFSSLFLIIFFTN